MPIPAARGTLFWNGLGFLTTLVAILLALVPPADTPDSLAFFVQVGSGAAGFGLVGLLFYALAGRKRRRTEAMAA